MGPVRSHCLLSLILAGFLGGAALANSEVDDAIYDTTSIPGTICAATPTWIAHGGGTSWYAETAEPGPTIGLDPGHPCATSDVDLYEFDIVGGTPCVLIVSVTRDFQAGQPGTDPGALDPYVILWDSTGMVVSEQDDYASEGGCTVQDSYMVYAITVPDTYYIGVSSLVGDGSVPPIYDPWLCCSQGVNYTDGDYDITIDIYSAAGAGGPGEPNDTIIDAANNGNITLGEPIDGVVGDGDWGNSAGDYDWYQFEVMESCSLITVTVQTDSIGSDLDAVVNVYDATCQILNQAIHFDPHQALDGEQECPGDTVCQWIVANPGDYYAEVHGNGTGSQSDDCVFAYAGGGAGSTGNYRLTVTVGPPGTYPTGTDPPSEPNDWMADATPTGLANCGDCYVLQDAFIGDGPCGCWPDDDTRGGDFDVYEVYLPTGCELLVCLETVERGDSQLNAAVSIWIEDGSDFLLTGLGDAICDGQCMWFCNPQDTEPTLYYVVVGGLDLPTDIAAPDPFCDDPQKEGVTGVGYYNLYISLEPYLGNCQPPAWVDLCPETGCAEEGNAYILRSHDEVCTDHLDTELADDFEVPPGQFWRICDIHAQFRAGPEWFLPYWLEPKPGPVRQAVTRHPTAPTISTVPTEIRFRIYANDPGGGCEGQDIPDDGNILWEYTVTGFVECSKHYDRGSINLFSNPAKRHAICEESSCDEEGFIELSEGKYWLSIVCRHSARDIGGNLYGWVTSNRPGDPCNTMPNGQEAQWKFNEGWLDEWPPPACGTDWSSQQTYFAESGLGDCPYDLAWKLTGELGGGSVEQSVEIQQSWDIAYVSEKTAQCWAAAYAHAWPSVGEGVFVETTSGDCPAQASAGPFVGETGFEAFAEAFADTTEQCNTTLTSTMAVTWPANPDPYSGGAYASQSARTSTHFVVQSATISKTMQLLIRIPEISDPAVADSQRVYKHVLIDSPQLGQIFNGWAIMDADGLDASGDLDPGMFVFDPDAQEWVCDQEFNYQWPGGDPYEFDVGELIEDYMFVGWCSECLCDLNSDGVINFTDLNIFALAFDSQCGDPNYHPCADFNGDCEIEWCDQEVFMYNYGQGCPGPGWPPNSGPIRITAEPGRIVRLVDPPVGTRVPIDIMITTNAGAGVRGAEILVDATDSKWIIYHAGTWFYPEFQGGSVGETTSTTFEGTGFQDWAGGDPGLGGGEAVPFLHLVLELTEPLELAEFCPVSVTAAGYIFQGFPTHTQVFNVASPLGCGESATALMGLGSCCSCVGDLSEPCDDYVNVTDATIFINAYLSQVGDPNYNPCADLAPEAGGDGFVNVTDFTVLFNHYLQPCP